MKVWNKVALLMLWSLVYFGITAYIFSTVPESNIPFYIGWIVVTAVTTYNWVNQVFKVCQELWNK